MGNKLMKQIILILFILFFLPSVLGSSYLDYLTYSMLNGEQNFDNADWFIDILTVNNLTAINTNIENATIINYNVTGDMDVYGTATFHDLMCIDENCISSWDDVNVSLDEYWKSDGSSTATGDWDIGTYDLSAENIYGGGTDSWFNQTLLISGDNPVSRNSDATLIIQSEVNYISCINLTEGGNLGFQICYDGTGGGEYVIRNMNGGTEYMTIDRDSGGITFHNETTFENVIVHNITTVVVTASAIRSTFSDGSIDIRGDPWYLTDTDLQIAENLIVDNNITADKIFSNNISVTGDICIAGNCIDNWDDINQSLDGYAKYQFGDNNFNGSGNITTERLLFNNWSDYTITGNNDIIEHNNYPVVYAHGSLGNANEIWNITLDDGSYIGQLLTVHLLVNVYDTFFGWRSLRIVLTDINRSVKVFCTAFQNKVATENYDIVWDGTSWETTDGLSHNDWSGAFSWACGRNTVASGDYSHAEGNNAKSTGLGSHAEGGSTASGDYSHAEGISGATGDYAHAEGGLTGASGDYAHVQGNNAQSSGDLTDTSGFYTINSIYLNTVMGRYNLPNGVSTTTWVATDPIFEIGNGASSVARNNAFSILKSGNVLMPNDDAKLLLGASQDDSVKHDGTDLVWTSEVGNHDFKLIDYKLVNLTNADLYVGGDVEIDGNLNVSKNVKILGNVSFENPHLFGYDNSTQSFLTLETAQVMNLSNTDYHSHQIEIIQNQNVTFSRVGHYQLCASPQFYQASGNDKWITFWLQENGVDVEWSNSRYTMDNDEYNAPRICWETIITNPATDNVRIMWLSDSTSSSIQSITGLTDPIRPSVPGVIIDVHWISNGD